MKKLPIAIALLAAAVVSAGSMTHHRSVLNTSKRTVLQTTQGDFPIPACPPDCALPTPPQVPN